MKRISLRGSLTHVVMAIILLVSFIGTGCVPKKPTQETMMLIEQSRLQREAQARAADEAKRQAEARLKEEEAAFTNEAKRYREMPVKPALPEDVQRCRVVAEDAFNNKDFEKSLEYYKKGLSIEPLWPQGQFNAAMIAGELHRYDWASLHMKRYLELVPDAANAKAAREKMYLWEEKAKEAGAGQALIKKLDGARYVYQSKSTVMRSEEELVIRGTTLVWSTRVLWASPDIAEAIATGTRGFRRQTATWGEFDRMQIVGREAHHHRVLSNGSVEECIFTISEDGSSINKEEKGVTYTFYRQ